MYLPPVEEEFKVDVSKFLKKLSETELTIPDLVVSYHMDKSGCDCSDVRLKRLVSLATQNFIFNVLYTAKRYSDEQKQKSAKQAATLKMEDLTSALHDQGVSVVKPPYFADTFTRADR